MKKGRSVSVCSSSSTYTQKDLYNRNFNIFVQEIKTFFEIKDLDILKLSNFDNRKILLEKTVKKHFRAKRSQTIFFNKKVVTITFIREC